MAALRIEPEANKKFARNAERLIAEFEATSKKDAQVLTELGAFTNSPQIIEIGKTFDGDLSDKMKKVSAEATESMTKMFKEADLVEKQNEK